MVNDYFRILEQARDLKFARRPKAFDHKIKAENHACGDYVDFYLSLDKNKIKELVFSANACVLATLAANELCRILTHKPISHIKNISVDLLEKRLGSKISSSRKQCLRLGLTSLTEALFSQSK